VTLIAGSAKRRSLSSSSLFRADKFLAICAIQFSQEHDGETLAIDLFANRRSDRDCAVF
jgi:hypothetical protein